MQRARGRIRLRVDGGLGGRLGGDRESEGVVNEKANRSHCRMNEFLSLIHI